MLAPISALWSKISFEQKKTGFSSEQFFLAPHLRSLADRIDTIVNKECFFSRATVKIVSAEEEYLENGFNKKIGLHPLFLLSFSEIPASLQKLCLSDAPQKKVSEEFRKWLSNHFTGKFTNKKFDELLSFYREIWKHPEMEERVRRFLLELKLELPSDFRNKHVRTFLTSFDLNTNLFFDESKLWLVLVFIMRALYFCCCLCFMALHILPGPFTSYRLPSILEGDGSVKEKDIGHLFFTNDIEAARVIFRAADAVRKKNSSLLTRWWPSLLTIYLSPLDRLANLETFAKKRNIKYNYQLLPLPFGSSKDKQKVLDTIGVLCVLGILILVIKRDHVIEIVKEGISSININKYLFSLEGCLERSLPVDKRSAIHTFSCFEPFTQEYSSLKSVEKICKKIPKYFRRIALLVHPDKINSEIPFRNLNAAMDILKC